MLRIFFKLMLGVLFITFLSGCSGETTGWASLETEADNSTQITGTGGFTPSTGASPLPCPKDAEGQCVDASENTEPVNLATMSINFDLGEENGQECREIVIPGGAGFQAQIDDDYGSPELFGVRDASGSVTTERVDGSGTLTVCYLRNEIGTHAARLNVFLNQGAAYAYVIPLSGQTLAPFFTITAPVEGQIIDSRPGQNAGTDNDEGDYLFTVTGSINTDLIGILKSGAQTPIIIDADGVKYRADFDAAGQFSQTIGVPQTPGIYSIKFTIEAGKSVTIEKRVGIVVAEKPELVIEVRDQSGAEITSGSPADVETLFIGFRIDNLTTAGSSATSMPVTLSGITLNDEPLADDRAIWYSGTSWCNNTGSFPAPLSSSDFTGFEPTTTYCLALTSGTELNTGVNRISATATNALGSSQASYDLILDYNKPVITIDSPKENEILQNGTSSITLSGTVKNYQPVTDSKPIPESKNNDTGSYCQELSGQQTSTCPPSGVTLWINQHPLNTPVYIYPEPVGFEGLSTEEMYDAIAAQNAEACRTVTDDQGATQRVCNIPEGRFSLTLTLPDTKLSGKLNLYTNILEMRAESLKASGSHRSIAMRVFRIGKINTHSFDRNPKNETSALANLSGNLRSGQLGSVESQNGTVESEPLLLNISEGVINNPEFKKVLQKLLNDYLPFENLANGWNAWPKDEDDKIDIEADFQRQYKKDTGNNYTEFWQLPDSWQKKFIQQSIHHGSMAVKYWGLIRYAGYLIKHGQADADEAHLLFYDREGNPENDFNVALDMCGQPITTSFVPLGDLRHINKPFYKALGWDLKDIPIKIPEWPDIAGQDIKFNDFVSGKWIVHDVNFKEGAGNSGVIDLDACLVPADADVEDCNQEIPATSREPAFWGHFTAYNLVEGGLMGPILNMPEILQRLGLEESYELDDPTLPMIWNVGKVRLQLRDVIRLRKIKLSDGRWTNKLELDSDNIANTKIKLVTNSQKDAEFPSNQELLSQNTIQVYPFDKCRSYYQRLLNDGTYNKTGWTNIPHGCNQDNPARNYPVIIERNSATGNLLYNTLFARGQSTYLLEAIWNGVMETFGKIIRCADTEMVNPILNPDVFPYPKWVPDESRMSTEFAMSGFGLGLNLAGADININHPYDLTDANALTVRLPFDLFLEDVMQMNIRQNKTAPAGKKSKNKKSKTVLSMNSGHLTRQINQFEINAKPFSSEEPESDMHLAVSANLEEIVNSAMHLVFQKGPLSLLKTFGIDDIKLNNNFSVGVDKVVFADFDVCDSFAGSLLKTDLPPGILFGKIDSQFSVGTALHLDIMLDKNYPVTFSMNPIELTENEIQSLGQQDRTAVLDNLAKHASEVQLGITNLQISAKELLSHGEERYSIEHEVVRVRVDGVISAKLIYLPSTQTINVYVADLKDQNIHLSPVPGKGGSSYDDVNVIDTLDGTLLTNVFSMLRKAFDPSGSEMGTFKITLKKASEGNALSLIGFNDMEMELSVEAQQNGECVGQKPRYLDATTTASTKGKKQDKKKTGTKTTKGKSKKPGQTATIQFNRDQDIEFANFTDPCAPLDTLANFGDGNPIAAALCDFGIKDITMEPEIEFDNNNGYIHLGTKINIKTYPWLKEEVF